MSFTHQELNEELESICASRYCGVAGVRVYDSGQPGPTVGITIVTHGNEIAGLAAARHFHITRPLSELLKKGRVIFCANNIRGSQRYFASLASGETESEAARLGRLIDINLNRLPDDVMTNTDRIGYECDRARELRPVWEEFEVALDIHSFTSANYSAIISIGDRFDSSLVRGFPIDTIYTNITQIQIGKPASAFYGHPDTARVLNIEAGQHTNETAFTNAVTCTTELLKTLGMIDGDMRAEQKTYNEYTVVESVMLPDESYELVRTLTFYEPLRAGEVIARGDGPDVIAPCDCLVIMPPRSIKPKDYREEVCFLVAQPKSITI